MYRCLILILVLHFPLYALGYSIDDADLKFSLVLWRHGERNPNSLPEAMTPKDPNPFPEGMGELTLRGVNHSISAGEYLADRYDEFLRNAIYEPATFYVQSTNMNRTLQTASAVMAGMVLNDDRLEREGLGWFPLPLHSNQDLMGDYLLHMSSDCKNFWPMWDEQVATLEEYKQFNKDNEEFFNELRKLTGVKLERGLRDMYYVQDPLLGLKRIGEAPAWLTDEMWERISDLYTKSTRFFFYTHDMLDRHGGDLIVDIRDKLQASLDGDATKFVGYSTHDTTIVALLDIFDAYRADQQRNATSPSGIAYDFPGFNSMIMIDLRQGAKDEYYVEVTYNVPGEPDYQSMAVDISWCKRPCKLETFSKYIQDNYYTEVSWDERCGNPVAETVITEKHSNKGYIGGIVVLAITTAVGWIAVAGLVLKRRRGF